MGGRTNETDFFFHRTPCKVVKTRRELRFKSKKNSPAPYLRIIERSIIIFVIDDGAISFKQFERKMDPELNSFRKKSAAVSSLIRLYAAYTILYQKKKESRGMCIFEIVKTCHANNLALITIAVTNMIWNTPKIEDKKKFLSIFYS